jgi:hypothetical protein
MKKALREIAPYVKLVDLVVEVVDARAPYASRNPFLKELIGSKTHMLLLSKDDFADPEVTKLWIEEAKKDGSFWYPTIWNKIQQKKEWKLAFEKIPLNQQPKVMKLFVEDMPKLQYIQEINKYLDNKMEEVYAKNINLLATTETEKQLDNEEEEFEEIDEEEAKDLLASLNTQNLDPTDEPRVEDNTNHEN